MKRVVLSRRSSIARRDRAQPVDLAGERAADRRDVRRPRPRAAPRRRCSPSRPARRRGRWRSSQSRHCASGCGCEATRRTSSSRPLCESSSCEMRSTTSPQIETSRSASESSVCVTTPSVVFSTGTTPRSACRARPRANTSAIVSRGTRASASCAELLARGQVREGPLRPEVARRAAASRASGWPEMISRKTGASPAVGKGPGLRAHERSTIWRSRAAS